MTEKELTDILNKVSDEIFIKEIHKGSFKSKDDPRKQYIESEAKNTKTCIQVANTKRLKESELKKI